MFLKNIYLAVCVTLLIAKPVWAESSRDYYVFDKVLSGTYTCARPSMEIMNINCALETYLRISGWVREEREGVPVEISEVTEFTELNAEYYMPPNNLIDSNHDLKACSKAINLVKSNPSKWDLKLGLESSDLLVYCEAINQSLMQQYYAEQE